MPVSRCPARILRDALDGLDLLMRESAKRLLSEAFRYNAIKHGLSTIALDGSTEISVTDDGGEKVVGHKGPLFAYVHKPRSPGDKSGGEWFVSMTGAKTEVDLSLAILIARAVESLWAVGRPRFTGKSGAIRRRAGDASPGHGLHEVAEHSIKPGPRGNHPRSGLALGAVHHKAGPRSSKRER
jgi:hypothetical protein